MHLLFVTKQSGPVGKIFVHICQWWSQWVVARWWSLTSSEPRFFNPSKKCYRLTLCRSFVLSNTKTKYSSWTKIWNTNSALEFAAMRLNTKQCPITNGSRCSAAQSNGRWVMASVWIPSKDPLNSSDQDSRYKMTTLWTHLKIHWSNQKFYNSNSLGCCLYEKKWHFFV